MTRTALYCRISSDREGGGLGVARQEQDGRELAERLEWDVARVFVDNDKSAYSGKRRPEYERLLTAIEAGEYDALIAWHPDRLHRSPKELERFIDVVERNRLQIATCQAGHVDLSTPTGRMTARVVGAVARHESEHKAERIRRKHLELARDGKVSGGGRRAFGYRNILTGAGHIESIELVPDEVELMHEAVARVLDGDGVTAICADWRLRQIPTTTGTHWSPTTMKRMLLSPRIAGMRTHKGEAVAEATWPAIIDYDTLLRLRAVLQLRAARPTIRARRYLLAGLLFCGRCDAKMTARPTARGVRRYICAADRGGCNRCGISALPLETLLTDATLQVLDTPAMSEALQRAPERSDSAATEVAEVEARLKQLAEMWAAGELSAVEWGIARDGLTKRREAAEDRVAASVMSGALADLVGQGEGLRRLWETFDFAQRRAVLVAAVDRVVIAPTVRANNRFDQDRVDVSWRI